MKNNSFFQYFLSVMVLLSLTACTSLATATPGPSAAPTTSTPQKFIVLGDISDDPGEVIDGTQPLADYLAAQLKDFGITGGKVRVVSSTDEMVELLKKGEIDLYFDSSYPATLISDASGAQIILRRWRFGVETYHSVIFTSRDSGITSLNDLKGKMVAMDAPYSTSGFMLPAVTMLENGLKLTGKQNTQEAVSPDEVGFVFAYDDENILQWVLTGLASAGVTDDYNFYKAFPRDAAEKLVVLAETESTPRQVVVARPGLDTPLLEAIKQTLIQMDEDPASKTALEKFQTTQFDEFPEGINAATQRMREMMELLKDIKLP
jgi:phosphonate transport system substrate-binding protein